MEDVAVECELCTGDPLRTLAENVVAVAPASPCSELDLWLVPRRHVVGYESLDSVATADLFEAVKEVTGTWRGNVGADGINVMGYTGQSPHWPSHVALRVVGRRASDGNHNPLRTINRGGTVPVEGSVRRAALAPRGDSGKPAPRRWDLAASGRIAFCDCCNDRDIERDQIATDGVVRLFQHAAATGPGLLLLAPVRHAERVEDLVRNEAVALFRCIERVDEAFRSALSAVGIYFSFNDGPVAGQETPHMHIHLWARAAGEAVNPFAGGLPAIMGHPSESERGQLRDSFAALLPPIWP